MAMEGRAGKFCTITEYARAHAGSRSEKGSDLLATCLASADRADLSERDGECPCPPLSRRMRSFVRRRCGMPCSLGPPLSEAHVHADRVSVALVDARVGMGKKAVRARALPPLEVNGRRGRRPAAHILRNLGVSRRDSSASTVARLAPLRTSGSSSGAHGVLCFVPRDLPERQ